MIDSNLESTPTYARLSLQGDLSFETAPIVRDALLELCRVPEVALTVDISGVESFDLAGVQLLFSARRTASAGGRALVVVLGSLRPRIEKLLQFAGLPQDDWITGGDRGTTR